MSKSINLVLVSIGNFQDYILDNIDQLIKLNHKSIYVITNMIFFSNFDIYKNDIKLINADNLIDKYNYNNVSKLDGKFRDGFWKLTSLRFFYIYSFMIKYDICNVIHIENDVLIYYNCDILVDKLDNTKLYIPKDSYNRAIPSILYIPNHHILKSILDLYLNDKNDMDNFAIISNNYPDLIINFPICIEKSDHSLEQQYVTKNYPNMNFIFDAAAIGQYIGGVDPRNMSSDTIGFINETSVIKYNNYEIIFKQDEDLFNKPFLCDDINIVPIFNLHIHCKNLIKFKI
jgi:hypothetical protein